MQDRKTQTAQQASPQQAKRPALAAARIKLMRAFAWHLRGFLAVNAVVNVINFFTGRPWWAFWPLVVTGLVLAIHYLFYKVATVDERWVDARVEELNLKSYDRSHIENLKGRHGAAGDTREDHRT